MLMRFCAGARRRGEDVLVVEGGRSGSEARDGVYETSMIPFLRADAEREPGGALLDASTQAQLLVSGMSLTNQGPPGHSRPCRDRSAGLQGAAKSLLPCPRFRRRIGCVRRVGIR